MSDSIGKLPKITDPRRALKEILLVALDNRGHIEASEHISWMELKFKAIRTLARKGLACKNDGRGER